MLRRLILTLLCLAIPLQGMAAALAFDRPCPMQSQMAEHVVHQAANGAAPEESLPECCLELGSLVAAGQACKCVQGAGVRAMAAPAVTVIAGPLAPTELHALPAAPAIVRGLPDGIWRPPALN